MENDPFVLELQVRSVYGVKRIYPMNALAKQLADLMGRKTLTGIEVAKLEDMGFAVIWLASNHVGNGGSIPD